MCNNCILNKNPYRNAHPQSLLQLLPFHLGGHQQASRSAAAFIKFAITADLEASARKGAQGFVFFIGNLQLQGPVSLNPMVGQRGLGSKCLSFPAKQRDQWGGKKKKADSESSWIPEPWLLPEINMRNNKSPESEQLRTHPWLHLGAALKSHLEFPESQVITFKLFPKPIFGEPWMAGISAKHNAMVQTSSEQWPPAGDIHHKANHWKGICRGQPSKSPSLS